MSSTSAVAVLAQGLRELRDFAEGPDGEELQQRTGLTTQQIEAALGGEELPTREVTLALVEAWEGDVEAWRDYWGQISDLAGEEGGGRKRKTKAATPTPPEPSIITPIPEGEGGAEPEPEGDGDESDEGGGPEIAEAAEASEAEVVESDAEADGEEKAAAEQEVARARSAARAQLEANAQAAKAQSEARASAQEVREAPEAAEEAAGQEQVRAAGGNTAPVEPEEGGAGAEAAQVAAQASGAAEAKPAPEKAIPAQRTAASSEDAAAKAAPQSSAVLEGVVVAGGTAKPAKKSMLARVGVPILVFAIGVGVGAFGDHALNSKQSSSDSSASVPPASASSKPSHSATSSASSPATVPSSIGANPSGAASSTDTVGNSGNGVADSSTSASTSSTVAPGTALGAYVGIQLASGYSVSFLTDPYHPAAGTSNGPDTMGFFASSFVDGRFYADRVAILDSTDTGSYTSCLNDTRYQHDVLLSQVAAGGSFCITTGTGHVVLVTVRRMPSSTDANPYAVLDVTVWQGN